MMNFDFGSLVFNDDEMKKYLPKSIYKNLRHSIETNSPLDKQTADKIAVGMRKWAISKGATHYSHWFQPLTGITAEKHDAFLSCENGKTLLSFSGKDLIKGEPDASSLPNGGERSTFEARGYTVWDPSSFPFIKDHSLCIPTTFCSYLGEALDKKTPLLRSIQALDFQCKRILKLFGKDISHIQINVGPEQEYFLIDESVYNQRKDLKLCGRTILGPVSVKGQEMDDQYFTAIKPRVIEYMNDLNKELWKLGIYAKTEHNETAPAQHEMAPIYNSLNIAADQNQLTMEIMKKVARKHGLICLLNEKPFRGINGSGKHNNWSISTDEGENLFNPGNTPQNNYQFLLFFIAIIKAIDENQDLLRYSVASASNDLRLGANEAPPAIISMYIGDEMFNILESIKTDSNLEQSKANVLNTGVNFLPQILKDNSDRNRTSPFAFTGNRFEFRSVGSSASISGPNTILNTILANSLSQFADELENSDKLFSSIKALIKRELNLHWQIIFNGNGYDKSWVDEASKRGLKNYRTTPEVVEQFLSQKNINLFEKFKVYSKSEMESRKKIKLEKYCQVINIDATTMRQMILCEILPCAYKYLNLLLNNSQKMQQLQSLQFSGDSIINDLNYLTQEIKKNLEYLTVLIEETNKIPNLSKKATSYSSRIIPQLNIIREFADKIISYLGNEFKPFPTYEDLLYSVQ